MLLAVAMGTPPRSDNNHRSENQGQMTTPEPQFLFMPIGGGGVRQTHRIHAGCGLNAVLFHPFFTHFIDVLAGCCTAPTTGESG
jgi:hypothetical protein